jgi:hypothetical protein
MRGFTLSYCLSYAHIPGYFTFPLQDAAESGFKRPPQFRGLLRAGSGEVQTAQRSYKEARVVLVIFIFVIDREERGGIGGVD